MAGLPKWLRLSRWLTRYRLAKVAPFVHGHVLDFGCGTGDLLSHCQPTSYCGYDVKPAKLIRAREQHPGLLFTDDLSQIEATGRKFDVIVLAAVLEHLESPRDTLASLRHLLAPDGSFVVTTPHPAWKGLYDFGAQKLGIFAKGASDEHKAFLREKELASLAGDLGLRLVHTGAFLFGANQLFVLR